jgi:hypothetical protein
MQIGLHGKLHVSRCQHGKLADRTPRINRGWG